jgi:ribosomal 30S subunit maturation factor RimM
MEAINAVNEYLELLKQKKEIDQQLDALRQVAMDSMQAVGLKQIKTTNATVSIAKRVTPEVDEVGFRVWAGEQPSFELDTFYVQSLNKKKVVDYSKHLLKQTGEVVPFISTTESEYLSVRPIKETEK